MTVLQADEQDPANPRPQKPREIDSSDAGKSDCSKPVPTADPVEQALADALQRAALAGAFDTVAALTAELRARREARAGVIRLNAERERRK